MGGILCLLNHETSALSEKKINIHKKFERRKKSEENKKDGYIDFRIEI